MDLEQYLKAHAMQRREALDVVEEFSGELSKMRGRCLDIGCGPGDITKELLLPRLPSDATVVGIDNSKDMTDYANQKYADDERLSFVVLDIEAKLSIQEVGKYDNAVSLFCLHWCKDIRLAFKNIYLLLRPDATALLEFLEYHRGFESYIAKSKIPRYMPYMQDAIRYVPYFQRSGKSQDASADLRHILKEIGFEVLRCSKREKNYTYENRETLRKHVIAINPFISRMPDDMKDSFIDELMNDLISKMIELPLDEKKKQDAIFDTYRVLLVYIKKPKSDP